MSQYKRVLVFGILLGILLLCGLFSGGEKNVVYSVFASHYLAPLSSMDEFPISHDSHSAMLDPPKEQELKQLFKDFSSITERTTAFLLERQNEGLTEETIGRLIDRSEFETFSRFVITDLSEDHKNSNAVSAERLVNEMIVLYSLFLEVKWNLSRGIAKISVYGMNPHQHILDPVRRDAFYDEHPESDMTQFFMVGPDLAGLESKMANVFKENGVNTLRIFVKVDVMEEVYPPQPIFVGMREVVSAVTKRRFFDQQKIKKIQREVGDISYDDLKQFEGVDTEALRTLAYDLIPSQSRTIAKISTGGIRIKPAKGKQILAEGTHWVRLSHSLEVPETGNEQATALINRVLLTIKSRQLFARDYFPVFMLEALAKKNILFGIVENNGEAVKLIKNGNGYLIAIDSALFELTSHQAIAQALLGHQISHVFDRLILEDFLEDRNIVISNAEKEAILLYRDAARMNLIPSEAELIQFACSEQNDPVLKRIDPDGSYKRLLLTEEFFNIGNDQRPIWVHAIRDFIGTHADDILYPASYHQQITQTVFEDFLMVRRWYEGYLDYWLDSKEIIQDGGVEFIFDKFVAPQRRKSFIPVLQNKAFLSETIQSIYGTKRRYRQWLKTTAEIDLDGDIKKIYIRFVGEGYWKKVYYVMLVPREGIRVPSPLEFCIALYNDSSSEEVTPQNFIRPGEISWMRRVSKHEENLVPKMGAVRIGQEAVFEENGEKIPYFSVEYAGANLDVLQDSRTISEEGKKRLLRFAMSKYIRLLYRMGGLAAIEDPKQPNITSLDWKLRIVDLGMLTGGLYLNEATSLADLHPESILGYAWFWWDAPMEPALLMSLKTRIPIQTDWASIQEQWKNTQVDYQFRPAAELEFIAAMGIPSNTTIAELSRDRAVEILGALMRYKEPPNQQILTLIKTLASRYKKYIGNKVFQYQLNSDEAFLSTLHLLRKEAYDKSYLLDGVIDVFTRTQSDRLPLRRRFEAGVHLLREMAQNRHEILNPEIVAFIEWYLAERLDQYEYPKKESTRPSLRQINWEEIDSLWQRILGGKLGGMSGYHRDMNVSIFGNISGYYEVEGKKLSDLMPEQMISMLRGIRESYYTPGPHTLGLLWVVSREYGDGILPSSLASESDYHRWIDSLLGIITKQSLSGEAVLQAL